MKAFLISEYWRLRLITFGVGKFHARSVVPCLQVFTSCRALSPRDPNRKNEQLTTVVTYQVTICKKWLDKQKQMSLICGFVINRIVTLEQKDQHDFLKRAAPLRSSSSIFARKMIPELWFSMSILEWMHGTWLERCLGWKRITAIFVVVDGFLAEADRGPGPFAQSDGLASFAQAHRLPSFSQPHRLSSTLSH